MTSTSKNLTPPYARFLVHLTRPFPDFDVRFIRPIRQKAVDQLNLKAGDRVLDLGCGMGGSFPYLIRAVGASGQVVGVEISREVAINARKRIENNGWKNIQLIEADARVIRLSGTFDGALMFAAADVYASQEALENIFPHLKDKARVAVFGAKTSGNRFGKTLNPILRKLFNLSFSTTPRPDNEPWRILVNYVEALNIEEYFFGLMFLGSATVASRRIQ